MPPEKKPKKILFNVIETHPGNAGRYVLELADNMRTRGYDVAVLLGTETAGNDKTETLQTKLERIGIRTISLSSLKRDMSAKGDIRSFRYIREAIRQEKPDIVHVNSSKAGGLGALAARLEGVNAIFFTAHGFPFRERVSLPTRIFRFLATYATVLFSTHTVTITTDDYTSARNWPLVSKKIYLIHNGIKPFEFLEKKEACTYLEERHIRFTPDEETKNKEPIWIGTVSELHRNKGLIPLLTALIVLRQKGCTFVCCIIGEGELRPNLEAFIEKHNLGNAVFLPGHIDNARGYLRAFDIFTLTSLKEGLPYAVLEAGHAGVPVIASRVGGIPEIIEHDVSGVLVPPEHTRAIAETLSVLIDNPEYRANIAANLKRVVDRDFTFSDMAEKTEALYRNSSPVANTTPKL